MQTISSLNPARAPRRIIAIFIGILSVLMLASCGGGGSTDPNATAQSADEATKTIQGVSGSAAVPGTWTGRASKMEVINGITVPPEPAPAINNATLAGVDVNSNGVRDDVERKIARVAVNKTQFDNAIIYARAMQAITNIGARPTDRQAALKIILGPECVIAGLAGGRPSSVNFSKEIFNTPGRAEKYQIVADVVGYVSGKDTAAFQCN